MPMPAPVSHRVEMKLSDPEFEQHKLTVTETDY